MKLNKVFIFVMALSGCSSGRGVLVAITHEPTLATEVPKIMKGRTTKGEVLKHFGMPDIEADGANSTVNANMPLVLMYGATYELAGVPIRPNPSNLMKLYPYSSIDEGHIVFVYEEFCHKGGDVVFVPVVNVGASTTYQFFNKLLIWINKRTELVDNYAFREEFTVQCGVCEILRKSPTHSVFYIPFGIRVGTGELCVAR
ncbi:MAG: hypothetical protein L0Z68_03620 [Gammaproteobacteria bacterium]|nr:hypothetical protein [Gammaproteobacteria bacterium]